MDRSRPNTIWRRTKHKPLPHRLSPPPSQPPKSIILLVHGFPQTFYQFLRAITPLCDIGCRTIAPDYHGAGDRTKPRNGYTQDIMARNPINLTEKRMRRRSSTWYDTPCFISFGCNHILTVTGRPSHRRHDRPHLRRALLRAHSLHDMGRLPPPRLKVYDRRKDKNVMWHFTFHSVLTARRPSSRVKKRFI